MAWSMCTLADSFFVFLQTLTVHMLTSPHTPFPFPAHTCSTATSAASTTILSSVAQCYLSLYTDFDRRGGGGQKLWAADGTASNRDEPVVVVVMVVEEEVLADTQRPGYFYQLKQMIAPE